MLKNYFENRIGLLAVNIKVVLTNNAINNVREALKKYCSNANDIMPFTYDHDDHVSYEEYCAKKYLIDIVSEHEEYDVYIQNGGYSKENKSIVIYFATDTDNLNNLELKNKLDSNALCFIGVNKEDERKLLLTSVNLRPYLAGSNSNRSMALRAAFHFNYNIKAAEIPYHIIDQVMNFPVARERIEEIEQRIKDWDGYLKIIEDSVHDDEYTVNYDGYKQDHEIRYLTFILRDAKVDWQKITKANDRQERVKLVEDEDLSIGGDKIYEGPYIGIIDEVNQSRSEIRIELDVDYQEKSQQGKLDISQHGNLYFSKLGDLAQAKRLREGLKRLQYGKAVNPHLEEFLFDACSAQLPQVQFKLEPEKFLLKSLNESQKRAVEGSLVADDLYLIQGPPGTGKTTVIAEICYQNAIKGKKTLIASQSNLAVDNALSRLVHDPKIRALRKGNISRVEDEGKPFIEDKVIETWLAKTAENCQQNLEHAIRNKSKFIQLYGRLPEIVELYEKYRERKEDVTALKKKIEDKDDLLIKLINSFEYFSKKPKLLTIQALAAVRADFNNSGYQGGALWVEYSDCLGRIEEITESIINFSKKSEGLLRLKEKIDLANSKINEVMAKGRQVTQAFTHYDKIFADRTVEDLSKEGLDFCKEVHSHLLNRPKWIFRLFPTTKKWQLRIMDFSKVGKYLHFQLEVQIKKTNALVEGLCVEKSKVETQVGSIYLKIESEIENQINLLRESIVLEKNKSHDVEARMAFLENAINEYTSEFPREMLPIVSIEKIIKFKDIKGIFCEPLQARIVYLEKKILILNEWIERIKSPEKENKTMLRKIYIDNANVIGITCVQSGSKGFSEEYPDFDVVVIDEVSKATPPELLLPMLKGKKIILVGDHKQLPPMVNENTLAELAERYEYPKDALEHLERCLFKELYENAPRELKTMLNVQYRMHDSIMDAINQFYMDEDHEGLICGIPEPDEKRQHFCGNKFIKNNQHILWIDIPLHSSYYEKRSGTSWYNQTEVEAIKRILEAINEEYKAVKKEKGPKEIGVITFYAAQSRLLQKELLPSDLLRYDSLILRVATVDRFQGMEKPVVIVSLVRNNREGRIGFAEKPERINVALSRAQELLIIVGCSELFCQKTKSSNAMKLYDKVRDTIGKHGGLIDFHEFNYLSR